MSIILHSGGAGGGDERWVKGLAEVLPDTDVRVWPAVGNVEDITFALIWNHPDRMLEGLPNLKAVCILGSGADGSLADPGFPFELPVARLVDPVMNERMAGYILAAALRFQRRFDDYLAQQQRKSWQRLPQRDPADFRIGILGLGQLGRTAAERCAAFGFDVAGWSRTSREIPGVACHRGEEGFAHVLARADMLVNLLPLTRDTRGIINRDHLAAMHPGGYFVNCARGAHVVEADLITAVRSGHIKAALLDVFETEPLAPDHPYWSVPGIYVTPHVSSLTNVQSALAQIAENYRRVVADEPLLNQINPKLGY